MIWETAPPRAPLADKGHYHAFITALTAQSPQAEQEGHHSLGNQDSQGLEDGMLAQADTFANEQGRELIPTFSIIDGRPGLPSPQSMKVSQVEIAAIDPDFDRGYCLYP